MVESDDCSGGGCGVGAHRRWLWQCTATWIRMGGKDGQPARRMKEKTTGPWFKRSLNLPVHHSSSSVAVVNKA